MNNTIRVTPVLSVAMAGFAITAAAAPASRPNILVILTDDLGYGDVHCLNPEHGKIPTPHMDRLAAQGMVFTEAHASASVCTPSRSGLLTGRYNWRSPLQHGILGSKEMGGVKLKTLFPHGQMTVAQLLKTCGYQTAGSGKWHLGGNTKIINGVAAIEDGPMAHGFDSYFLLSVFYPPFMFAQDDRYLTDLASDGTRVGEGHVFSKPKDFSPVLPITTDKAVAAIEKLAAGDKPFFIYFDPLAPHNPYVPTQEWKGKSGLGDYADYVMETDAEIGRLLAALEKSGKADNTLVVFTSDNGCAPYAGNESPRDFGNVKRMEAKGHFPSADRRGYKSDAWDGGHRVPLIVRWPGHVKAGTQCGQLVCLTDLMATCADITGTTVPEAAAVDSVSFLPLLLARRSLGEGGSGVEGPVRETLVSHSMDGKFAIREGKWKLILCAGSGGWSAPKDAQAKRQGFPAVQLYDMSQDIGERKNLQSEYPKIVKDLTAKLEKIVADGRSTPGPKQQNDVPVKIIK